MLHILKMICDNIMYTIANFALANNNPHVDID